MPELPGENVKMERRRPVKLSKNNLWAVNALFNPLWGAASFTVVMTYDGMVFIKVWMSCYPKIALINRLYCRARRLFPGLNSCVSARV